MYSLIFLAGLPFPAFSFPLHRSFAGAPSPLALSLSLFLVLSLCSSNHEPAHFFPITFAPYRNYNFHHTQLTRACLAQLLYQAYLKEFCRDLLQLMLGYMIE